jgi:clan AA aspartic protease (TIGR02281 family)
MRKTILLFIIIFPILFISSCVPVSITKAVVCGAGKLTWETAKITGKTAAFTGKTLYKGARSTVYMLKGKTIVPLEKRGNSFYVTVILNKRVKAKLLLDTGATDMQISNALAGKLKLNYYKGKTVPVSIAGGYTVSARKMFLKQVRVGKARVSNVEVLVFEKDIDDADGLLGMSFLNNFNFQINPQKPELILEQKVIS